MAGYKRTAPKVTKEPGPGRFERDKIEHESFGVVEVTRSHGGAEYLFNSAMRHNTIMNIKICKAVAYRDLHRTWTFTEEPVCEIKLSEAQWANLISSIGMGAGTACTFRSMRDGNLHFCDGIENGETMKETHVREIKEQMEKYTKGSKELVAELQALVDSGKAGKGQLQEVLKKAQSFSSHFAGNMAFAQEQMEEAAEHTISEAKTEIEAFAMGTVTRLGLEKIAEFNAPQLSMNSHPLIEHDDNE